MIDPLIFRIFQSGRLLDPDPASIVEEKKRVAQFISEVRTSGEGREISKVNTISDCKSR